MRPHSTEGIHLRVDLAHLAVLRQAQTALPADPARRAEEGRRRAEEARREVAESIERSKRCECRPGEAVTWARAVIEVVEAVYRLLRNLGIIGPDGAGKV